MQSATEPNECNKLTESYRWFCFFYILNTYWLRCLIVLVQSSVLKTFSSLSFSLDDFWELHRLYTRGCYQHPNSSSTSNSACSFFRCQTNFKIFCAQIQPQIPMNKRDCRDKNPRIFHENRKNGREIRDYSRSLRLDLCANLGICIELGVGTWQESTQCFRCWNYSGADNSLAVHSCNARSSPYIFIPIRCSRFD